MSEVMIFRAAARRGISGPSFGQGSVNVLVESHSVLGHKAFRHLGKGPDF